MSDEYTPTTADVESCYVYTGMNPDRSTITPAHEHVLRAEFDRWLAERDARIRAEVIDWFAHETFPYTINKAREHFGLTKGADRG
jgi:flavin-dependent dehydrogenase